VRHSKLVETITPAGRKPKCVRVFIRASLHVREISVALVKLIGLMHSCGYCLDGLLTLSMLYWIDSTKSLKVGGLTRNDIKKWSSLGATRDYYAVDRIVRTEIFCTDQIPKELEAWLLLLLDDPLSNIDLITKNMFLLDDEAKVAEYMIIFQKLQQVKGISADVYATALSFVVTGHLNGVCLWQAYALQSYLLEKVKNYNSPPNVFTNSVDDMVLFGRHGCHHLCEGSVKTIYHNNAEILYLFIRVSEIYSHMETFLPGLFAQVQKGYYVALRMLEEANLPMP
jgi:hypothetical protein